MKKNKMIMMIFLIFFSSALFGNAMNIEKDFIPFGINVSYSEGWQFGGEVSFVHFNLFWYGIYAEIIYNNEKEKSKFSIGPEFGFMFAGIDAGFLIEEDHMGITGRLLVNCVIPHAYIRVNYLPHYNTSFEFGLLIKFPVVIN